MLFPSPTLIYLSLNVLTDLIVRILSTCGSPLVITRSSSRLTVQLYHAVKTFSFDLVSKLNQGEPARTININNNVIHIIINFFIHIIFNINTIVNIIFIINFMNIYNNNIIINNIKNNMKSNKIIIIIIIIK